MYNLCPSLGNIQFEHRHTNERIISITCIVLSPSSLFQEAQYIGVPICCATKWQCGAKPFYVAHSWNRPFGSSVPRRSIFIILVYNEAVARSQWLPLKGKICEPSEQQAAGERDPVQRFTRFRSFELFIIQTFHKLEMRPQTIFSHGRRCLQPLSSWQIHPASLANIRSYLHAVHMFVSWGGPVAQFTSGLQEGQHKDKDQNKWSSYSWTISTCPVETSDAFCCPLSFWYSQKDKAS